MSSRGVQDRLVLITGASSGIGRALAIRFAQLGAELILNARRQDALADVAAQVERHSGHAATQVVGDITDPMVRQRLAEAPSLIGRPLDVLINNAGVSAHGRFHESGPDRLRQILEVNFIAPAELTRECLAAMVDAEDPVVVNVGSILGVHGVPHNSEYAASKAAVRAWSEAIRPELATENVDVLLVTPGTTDTPFFDHLIERHEEMPWGSPRGVSPEFVADQVVTAIRKRRREVRPGIRAKLFTWAARLAPGLMARRLKRYG